MHALYVHMGAGSNLVHLVRHAGMGAITLCGRPPLDGSFHVLPSPPHLESICRSCIRSHRRIYGSDLPKDGGAS